MANATEIIEILDRKFDFLMQSSRKDFMLDLDNFLIFLTEDDRVKDFSEKIYLKFVEGLNKNQETQEAEKKKIVALSNTILKKYPEIDDRKKPFPKDMRARGDLDYMFSFAKFNDIVTGTNKDNSIPLSPDMMDDGSDPQKLLGIISSKIEEYEGRDERGKKKRKMDETIKVEYGNLQAQRNYNFKKWINSCRVSAANSLLELLRISRQINPEPKSYKNFDEKFKEFGSNDLLKNALYYGWITDVTYGVISQYSNHKPNNLKPEEIDKKFEILKYEAKRIYEGIREEIGTNLIHLQTLNKYKTRCTWYNFEEVRDLVLDNTGDYKKDREKYLTLDLAKYLYDNGFSVIYRLKAGQHEMDMVDPDAKNPLLIEVKAYKDSSAKQKVIEGVSQLHSYLTNLSSVRDLNTGYYVVYRCGGPLYELPEKIKIGKFTIYILIIDVGKSKDSGSRQPKPVLISEKEIFDEIKSK